MCKRERANVWVILIVTVVAADLFCTIAFYLIVHDDIRPVSLHAPPNAVVLFNGFDADGKLNDETLRRLNHAVEYINRSGKGLVICSGGSRPQSGKYGSLLMRDYLLQLEFDPATVIAETLSNSTPSNLHFSSTILEKHGIRDATVVSSPAHMLRIRSIAPAYSTQVAYQFSAYSYQDCVPPVEWYAIYGQIHHELAALLANALLPDRYYVQWLNWIRS